MNRKTIQAPDEKLGELLKQATTFGEVKSKAKMLETTSHLEIQKIFT